MAIEIRHLRCLLTLTQSLDFAEAAERLETSERAVVAAVRELESELGVSLVRRDGARVAPTRAGSVFAEDVGNVIASLDLAVAEARRGASVESAIRIGCVPDVSLQRLQSFLGAVQTRSGTAQIEVIHLPTREQLTRLRLAQLDLGVIHHAEGDAVETEPLFPGERLTAYLPAGHRLTGRPAISLGDLCGDTVLVVPRGAEPGVHTRLAAAMLDGGSGAAMLRETSGADPRDVLFAVADGAGVAVGSMAMAHRAGDVAGIVTRRAIEPAQWMPDTMLAWRSQPRRELDALIGVARGVARELYAST
jgi:DNA-binding transcriptional LysR family regulator